MIHARTDYQERIQDSAKKIPDNEPVFVLRAQDQTAAAVIRHWIRLNRRALIEDRKAGNGEVNEAGRKKAITLAEAHAYRFDDWPKKKPADV